MIDIPHRDITLLYPPRQPHEPHRFRVHHKPTGIDGIGEAATLEMAQAMAWTDLEAKLRDAESPGPPPAEVAESEKARFARGGTNSRGMHQW